MREVNLPTEARTKALDFESFFRAEYRSLSQALLLLVGDAFEAEEIAQEAMSEGLRALGPRRQDGLAGRVRVSDGAEPPAKTDPSARRPYEAALRPGSGRGLRTGGRGSPRRASALAALPEGQREALILVDWLDMDTEEAARVLGIKPASVRFDCIARVRRCATRWG